MEKLGAADANFLYTETDKVLNHVASVQQFRLPQDTSVAEFVNGLKRFLSDRIHLVPYLTRKVHFIPGDFDHPVWAIDDKFDIDNHVLSITLDDPSQLESKIAELHSIKMDRNRPLWTLYVISGQEDGTVTYYNQAHHACLDGMAGQAATMTLMDNTPDHPDHQMPENFLAKENTSMGTLLSLSFENLFKFQLDSHRRYLGTLDTAVRLAQRAVDPSRQFGAITERAPSTRFNKSIGVERSYAQGRLSLAHVKKIGKALDCKVNDVFLAVCAGGLRSLLEREGELPSISLIAGCPVSMRKRGDKGLGGNNVTMMSVSLATHLSNPLARLRAIRASANTAKAVTADLAAGYEPNIATPGLPGMSMAAAAASEWMNAADTAVVPINLVISNVPGPRETLYSNGAEMMSHYPVSIPVHGLGLNITVQSYRDQLFFGVTACKKALPVAADLRDEMLASFDELFHQVLPDNVTALSQKASLVPDNEDLQPMQNPAKEEITEKVA